MVAGMNPMLDRFERCFNGDGADYTFTTSHVAISGTDVEVKLEGGEWVLTQRQDGLEWTARCTDKVGAVLLLIAARMGMTGQLRYVPEEEDGH